jgi:hypothetical protein
MNEISDALILATHAQQPQAQLAGYPVALATDGEWLAYRPGSPQFPPQAACLLESLLPEIRQLALHLALRRGLPRGRTPSRIAEAADWLAARMLLLEWRQLAVGLDELSLLDEANLRARQFAEAAGWEWTPTLPLLLPAGRTEGMLQGWSAAPASAQGEQAVPASLAFRRTVAARFAALFAR